MPDLAWDGGVNVRDLGGLPADGGAVITEHDGAERVGLEVVSAPLFRQDDEAFAAAARATPGWPAFYRLVVETRSEYVAAAVGAVADAEPGGVLVHCMAGKDRTGIVCALSLSLAGVSDEEIGADFAASGDALRPIFENPEDADIEPELILDTLALLRRRHGSVKAYLLDAGLEPVQIERLRKRLLA